MRRQMIGNLDIGYPSVEPHEIHRSHYMKNDSSFFIWPKCQWCGLDAIHYGYILTKPCQHVTDEDNEEQIRLNAKRLREARLMDLNVGDMVVRMVAGVAPMDLRITAVTRDIIHCGGWKFDRRTGDEVDEYLDWGPPPKITGSYLKVERKRP